MTTFDSLPPMGSEGPNAARERTLARDVMEVAVFLSAREGDNEGFQRHMAQVGVQVGKHVYTLRECTYFSMNFVFLEGEQRGGGGEWGDFCFLWLVDTVCDVVDAIWH